VNTPIGTRWWVAPPRSQETLGSVVARAAQLYHTSAHALWADLNPEDAAALGEMDNPTRLGLQRLGATIGMPPAALVRYRLGDVPWRLRPEARVAVCPACVDAGRGPYRADWSRVFVPTCPLHAEPLRLPANRGGKSEPPARSELSETDCQVLALIERFGLALEQALHFGGTWPSGWHGSASQARTLVLRACLPLGMDSDLVPISQVNSPGALAAWVHGTAGHPVTPVHGCAIERFRGLANPALRRAALWVGAWLTVPNLPESLQPGWGDWHRILTRPGQWEVRARVRRASRPTHVH
jgi:hypothetical protein